MRTQDLDVELRVRLSGAVRRDALVLPCVGDLRGGDLQPPAVAPDLNMYNRQGYTLPTARHYPGGLLRANTRRSPGSEPNPVRWPKSPPPPRLGMGREIFFYKGNKFLVKKIF